MLVSVQQMDEIIKGERAPSREFHIDAIEVKGIRKATGLTQDAFARHIGIEVATLRNWEQGRREPTGPAKALLTALKIDLKLVIQALMPTRG
ncbi:helix-turn-helix domain-containing protein [Marinospirillum minutulum]|uniref:helix-turn-helix domain-containing protein n=1 Tax=Marinospirillum minutulum TaxID=64974 RepID=UPI0004848FA4|nr:helix-turn-helix domain-containing protein [Marinospirillum minutulum]